MKDADEIALLDEAQSCTDIAFDDILERLAVGITERRSRRSWSTRSDARAPTGCRSSPSWPSASRPRSRTTGPTHRVLEEGDVIKMDFAGRYRGYHADMTRTIAFGSPPAELRKIHDVVRQAAAGGDRRRSSGRDRR